MSVYAFFKKYKNQGGIAENRASSLLDKGWSFFYLVGKFVVYTFTTSPTNTCSMDTFVLLCHMFKGGHSDLSLRLLCLSLCPS